MNATISMPVSAVPPALQLAADEFPRALALLLIPTSLLYSAIYTHLQARYTAHVWLTFTSIACYLACPWLTPVQCGFFHSLQNFASRCSVVSRPIRQELTEQTHSRHRMHEGTGHVGARR